MGGSNNSQRRKPHTSHVDKLTIIAMYQIEKHCYYIRWLPADFCVLVFFFFWKLLFFWSPVRHGFQPQFPLDPVCEFEKLRNFSEFVSYVEGPGLPRIVPVCVSCPRVIINSVLSHSVKCPGLDSRLHGHPIYRWSGGNTSPLALWYVVILWNNMKMNSMILLVYRKIKFCHSR